ncbi:MAG: hypothetical protein KC912_19610 [Proteobacteria bacterium]|nr:hypothetical protein [Pseudomonadota bacterium]
MRSLSLLFVLALSACGGDSTPLDLTERLGAGESRAGRIGDAAALIGGPSAEAQVGDFKIYNDRVQYFVQSMRDGGFMVRYGGMVIDGDVVRAEGEPGRDIVEEWTPALGVVRLFEPISITVVANGSAGGAAHIRVISREAPLEFITGTLEAPDFVDIEGVIAVTDYRLEPDGYLLDVETRLLASERDTSVIPGDLMLAAQEVSAIWDEGSGFERATEAFDWTGFVGHRADVSALLLAGEDPIEGPPGVGLIDGLLTVAGGYGPEVELTSGDVHVYNRFYGVGPDPATLTTERLERLGLASQEVSDQVTAPDGPVAGARVNIFVDDAPYTVAITDEEGRFSAKVPAGTVRYVTDGRHRGRFFDTALGAPEYGPYASETERSRTLSALREGTGVLPVAAGRGLVDGLVLEEPGSLLVTSNGPFELRAWRTDANPTVEGDVALHGSSSLRGWSGHGALTIPVVPGDYRLLVHRGPRFEIVETTVTVEAGGSVAVDATLDRAFEHAGFLLGDPHIHAAPSSDGDVSMVHRLQNAAGVGLQIHFGTDHDAVADYRPLLEPLGLDGTLASVVADEVSPSLRGHTNIYPLSQTSERNGGAHIWWEHLVETTDEHVAKVRAKHEDRFILQLNHPLLGGFAGAGNWSPGVIGDPEAWSDDFQAVELLSGTEYESYIPLYLDLVSHGFVVTPTGASDAHDVGGSIGLSATYFAVGDDPGMLTDADILDVFDRRATVVSRGLFIDTDVAPGATVAPGTTLVAEAKHASWVGVDRMVLYKDGVAIDTVQGASATWSLDSTEDAFFVVEAVGDTPMEPVWGSTPWAMTAAIFVDAGADGWTAPLGPMQYGE